MRYHSFVDNITNSSSVTYSHPDSRYVQNVIRENKSQQLLDQIKTLYGDNVDIEISLSKDNLDDAIEAGSFFIWYEEDKKEFESEAKIREKIDVLDGNEKYEFVNMLFRRGIFALSYWDYELSIYDATHPKHRHIDVILKIHNPDSFGYTEVNLSEIELLVAGMMRHEN